MIGNLRKRLQKFWDFGDGRTALAAFCAHSVSISIGICQGYSAILLPQLKSSQNIPITSEECSWLASLGAVTNPLGSILSGLLGEYVGRKRAIQISSVPFLIGWLCIGWADSIEWLYVGRLITGIAAGMSTASYTYVSEISKPESRGIFQSLGPICASFGILLTYTLGYYVTWSTVAFFSTTFALFTVFSVQLMPQSPVYLMRHADSSKSFACYLWFRRNNALAQQEIDNHAKKHGDNAASAKSGIEQFFQAQTMKPFLILVTLFFLQELSGIYTILFYAVDFFEETGINLDKYVSSIVVGAIRFTMSLLSALLINKCGRKILCMTSSAGMSLTMLLMAAFFKYYEDNPFERRMFPHLPLVCVILNVVFSMVGMLPIPWILVGEMFPLRNRSIMTGVVICIAQTFIFLAVKIYPDMIALLNFSGTLATFSVAAIGALFFSKWVLPETKNKTLHEIEEYFRQAGRAKQMSGGVDNVAFDLKPEVMSRTNDCCCEKNEKNKHIFTIHVQT